MCTQYEYKSVTSGIWEKFRICRYESVSFLYSSA